MSRYIEVMTIVEGATEEDFIRKILAPYLGIKNIGMYATQVSKPGQKGGDVRFERVKNDIVYHLKQRNDTFVALFLDYYGLTHWPGLDLINGCSSPSQIEEVLVRSTMNRIKDLLPDRQVEKRFVPFFMVHEFEALLFSDSAILARRLGIEKKHVDKTLEQFSGKPEMINNSRDTAPSKRLQAWMPAYKKTITGIPIAEEIGIDKMRLAAPLFDAWLKSLEAFVDNCCHNET